MSKKHTQVVDSQGQSTLTLQRTITQLRGDVCDLKRKLLQQRKAITNEQSFTDYLYNAGGNVFMVAYIVCFTLISGQWI